MNINAILFLSTNAILVISIPVVVATSIVYKCSHRPWSRKALQWGLYSFAISSLLILGIIIAYNGGLNQTINEVTTEFNRNLEEQGAAEPAPRSIVCCLLMSFCTLPSLIAAFIAEKIGRKASLHADGRDEPEH